MNWWQWVGLFLSCFICSPSLPEKKNTASQHIENVVPLTLKASSKIYSRQQFYLLIFFIQIKFSWLQISTFFPTEKYWCFLISPLVYVMKCEAFLLSTNVPLRKYYMYMYVDTPLILNYEFWHVSCQADDSHEMLSHILWKIKKKKK